MELQASQKIYDVFKKLLLALKSTYSVENYNDVLPFIDRAGWKTPDHIHKEGGLNLHVDKPGIKFRPVQCFLSLTDQLQYDHGGLQIIKGFHNKYPKFKDVANIQLRGNGELTKELENVNVKAGSLVLWDYRLPHKTNDKFISMDTREVIYLSYIPKIPYNFNYCKQQYKNYLNGLVPPDFEDEKRKQMNTIPIDYDKNLNEEATNRFKIY